MKIKLAGVTFNNNVEDGGRNRQDILRELVGLNRSICTVDLIYTKHNEEFAIKVREHVTKQIVGWIPKSEIERFSDKKTKQLTGFIRQYNKKENLYCMSLDNQQAPTHKQYAYMKHICEQNGYAMPAYDKRAYTAIFNMVREDANAEK